MMKMLQYFGIILLGSSLWYGYYEKQPPDFQYIDKKYKAVCMVAPPKKIGQDVLDELLSKHLNSVALMPYAFLPQNSNTLKYSTETDSTKQWWGETPAGIEECIRMAHKARLRVMLKPHIWLRHGTFTGHLKFEKEADWLQFEKSYAAYILQYAQIAQNENIDMLCIGTELQNFVAQRPMFWYKLIADIKKTYKGKLTYAENWDSYQKVPFWKELDFIGVDAYFPLTDTKSPDSLTIKKGWQKYLKELQRLSATQNRPILFTEIGYKSEDNAAAIPWDNGQASNQNTALQALLYQTFFEAVWSKPYFAGAFFWKWFAIKNSRHTESYSPQNKPAEQILIKNYAKN